MPKKAEKKETTQVKSDELVVKEVAEKKSSKKATKPKKETKVKDNLSDNLTNFDWHNFEEGIEQVDEKQIKEFEKEIYSGSD